MDTQQKKQLMVFGYGMPVILTFLAWRHTVKHAWDGFSAALCITAAVFLTITLFSRPILIRLFTWWMKVAGIIGAIVTTVILVVIYYGLFTPVSIALKISNKDFMRLRQQKESYWIIHEQHSDKESYTQQF